MSSKIHASDKETVKSQCDENYLDYSTFLSNILVMKKRSNCQTEFKKYSCNQGKLSIFAVFHCCLSLYFMFSKSTAMSSNNNSILSIVSLSFCAAFVVATGWFLIMYKTRRKINSATPKLISVLENAWAFNISVSYCLSLFVMMENGQCLDNSFIKYFGCNSNVSNKLPEDMMIVLMILPGAVNLVARGVDWEVILASWVMNISVIAFCIGYYDRTLSLGSFLIYAPLTFLIMFETQRQNIMSFLLYHKQSAAMAEVEKQTIVATATEMRSMIGNVAHDLKTPLTAFTSGVDLMSTVLTEIHGKYKELDPQNPFVLPRLTTLQENIKQVKNINSFMLMSINRCIDFTKASNNVKLVPMLETLNVADTINLPLNCIKDMQSKVSITLHAISDNIAANIITDKQWLQENILCLLSNAVKYSTKGMISITLVLIEPPGGVGGNPATSNKMLRIDENGSQISSNQVSMSGSFDLSSIAHSIQAVSKSNNSKQTSSNASSNSPLGKAPVKSKHNSLDTIDEPTVNLHTLFAAEANKSKLQQITAAILRESLNMNLTITEPLLRVEVEDTGIGLSDSEMRQLFQPFKQAQRMAGGTGLGLYSLAQRMEALGGYYGVQRRRDGIQGSLFWFEIPYRPDTTKLRGSMLNVSVDVTSDLTDLGHCTKNVFESTNTESVKTSVRPVSPRKLNVLLVDDSLSIVKMTSLLLKRQGHTISSAENGAVAVDKFLEQRTEGLGFDVIIMDLQMPVMDGLEATRRIRQHERLPAVTPPTTKQAINSPTGGFDFLGFSNSESVDPFAIMSNKISDHSRVTRDNGNSLMGAQHSEKSTSHKAANVHLLSSSESRSDKVTTGRIVEYLSPRRSSQDNSLVSPSSKANASFDPIDDTHQSGGGAAAGHGGKSVHSTSSRSYIKRPTNATGSVGSSPDKSVDPHNASSKSLKHNASTKTLKSSAGKVPVLIVPPRHQIIIAASANSDNETMEAAFAAGIDAFMPKPFTLQTFNETYERVARMLDCDELKDCLSVTSD